MQHSHLNCEGRNRKNFVELSFRRAASSIRSAGPQLLHFFVQHVRKAQGAVAAPSLPSAAACARGVPELLLNRSQVSVTMQLPSGVAPMPAH